MLRIVLLNYVCRENVDVDSDLQFIIENPDTSDLAKLQFDRWKHFLPDGNLGLSYQQDDGTYRVSIRAVCTAIIQRSTANIDLSYLAYFLSSLNTILFIMFFKSDSAAEWIYRICAIIIDFTFFNIVISFLFVILEDVCRRYNMYSFLHHLIRIGENDKKKKTSKKKESEGQ